MKTSQLKDRTVIAAGKVASPRRMTRYTVELLHHDSPQRYKHFGVTAVVNGPYWVELYKDDGTIVMFPKEEIFRMRLEVE